MTQPADLVAASHAHGVRDRAEARRSRRLPQPRFLPQPFRGQLGRTLREIPRHFHKRLTGGQSDPDGDEHHRRREPERTDRRARP
jgi:hypothetical protein